MINSEYLEPLLFALRPIGTITSEEMFGGDALYFNGYLFGICYKDRLYFKVNDATREPYLHAGMQPFAPSPRVTLRDYYEV
ncbi:MAG: TfoX/Sxy family protein, partial [Planctomycetes bacterium]|nr:TfoX/Sxy family protein [Planctomycetota bacterium]